MTETKLFHELLVLRSINSPRRQSDKNFPLHIVVEHHWKSCRNRILAKHFRALYALIRCIFSIATAFSSSFHWYGILKRNEKKRSGAAIMNCWCKVAENFNKVGTYLAKIREQLLIYIFKTTFLFHWWFWITNVCYWIIASAAFLELQELRVENYVRNILC